MNEVMVSGIGLIGYRDLSGSPTFRAAKAQKQVGRPVRRPPCRRKRRRRAARSRPSNLLRQTDPPLSTFHFLTMADASFLTSTRGDPTTSVAGEETAMATKKSSSAAADAAAKSATAELYRTNLLRLETSELLNESTLHLSPFSGELDREVKWSDDVRKYIEAVKAAIGGMDNTVLGPDNAAMPPLSSSDDSHDKDGTADKRYWASLMSDKFHKQGSGWSFPFAGGRSLQIEPVGEYGAGGAGMTNQRGNALCLPMVDLAVLSPSSSAGNGEDDMIGGKDYLNGRYFDVSKVAVCVWKNIFVGSCHILQSHTSHVVIHVFSIFRIRVLFRSQ